LTRRHSAHAGGRSAIPGEGWADLEDGPAAAAVVPELLLDAFGWRDAEVLPASAEVGNGPIGRVGETDESLLGSGLSRRRIFVALSSLASLRSRSRAMYGWAASEFAASTGMDGRPVPVPVGGVDDDFMAVSPG
jgi:hypothetical protein